MMLKLTPLLKYEKWTNPEGHGDNQDQLASLGSHGCSQCCSSWFSPEVSCCKPQLLILPQTHSAFSGQICSPRFHAGIHHTCSHMKQGDFLTICIHEKSGGPQHWTCCAGFTHSCAIRKLFPAGPITGKQNQKQAEGRLNKERYLWSAGRLLKIKSHPLASVSYPYNKTDEATCMQVLMNHVLTFPRQYTSMLSAKQQMPRCCWLSPFHWRIHWWLQLSDFTKWSQKNLCTRGKPTIWVRHFFKKTVFLQSWRGVLCITF